MSFTRASGVVKSFVIARWSSVAQLLFVPVGTLDHRLVLAVLTGLAAGTEIALVKLWGANSWGEEAAYGVKPFGLSSRHHRGPNA